MPTILLVLGWRFFFYANEGNEPIHLHCRKGDMECKYWLDREILLLRRHTAKREVKKIIFEYFDFIETEWDRFHNEGRE